MPMTISSRIRIPVLAALILAPIYPGNAQPGNEDITRFDSCWTWSYKSGPDIDLDSLLREHFPDYDFPFGHSWHRWPHFYHDTGLALEPYYEFQDSAWSYPDLYGSPDSLRLMDRFFEFQDSGWSHFPEFDFPYHSPGEFPSPFFGGDAFDKFFKDMMEEFYWHSPENDSIYMHLPGWHHFSDPPAGIYRHRSPPGIKKNSSPEFDI